MATQGPLCKRIKNDKGNIKSAMWIVEETVNITWCASKDLQNRIPNNYQGVGDSGSTSGKPLKRSMAFGWLA